MLSLAKQNQRHKWSKNPSFGLEQFQSVRIFINNIQYLGIGYGNLGFLHRCTYLCYPFHRGRGYQGYHQYLVCHQTLAIQWLHADLAVPHHLSVLQLQALHLALVIHLSQAPPLHPAAADL